MTLSGKLVALAAVALLSLPASLAAQEQADSPAIRGRDIVVTGIPDDVTTGQVRRQARDIAQPAGSIFEVPLARFEDRLCPGVVGLQDDFAFAFNARIRANAEMLGIRLLDNDCRPNFVVFFSNDGEQFFRNLIDQRPEYFRFLHSGEISDILETGPVHVWTNVQPRTFTGMPIAQVRDLTRPPTMRVSAAHSRIYTTTRNDITTVMIAFDRDAVSGKSLQQLADYATMRGLAQTRPPGDAFGIDSILTLFDNESPPLGMTEFDEAYLRALYDGMPNVPGFRKIGATARQWQRMAEGAGGVQAGEAGD